MKTGELASEKGKYLYADYSQFDENKNFLAMLKDFVDLSSNIFQIQKDLDVLYLALTNANILQREMIAEIEKFRASAQVTLDGFNNEHNKIINDRFPLPSSSDNDLFLKTKSSLMQLLSNTKDEYSQKIEDYKEYLKSKIVDLEGNAIKLLQDWLSRDYYELPYTTITSKALNRLEVRIDNIATTKHYTITKTTAIALQQAEENRDSSAGSVSSVSYSLTLSGSALDFWNYGRKVSDVDVKDVLIPFGLKTTISKKIRQSLAFVPGLSKEPAEKEPGFVNVDGYFIASVALDDKDRTLSVMLANNPLELEYNVIKISYDVPELYNEKTSAQRYAEGKLPKIDCTLKDGEVQDVLQIKEVAESIDISKIILFGRALMDKMKLLSNPSIWSSKSKLVHLRLDEKDALLVAPTDPSSPSRSSLYYGPERVTVFLEKLAKSYTPFVRKLKEKSAVKGELILRHENEDGSREEHTVKLGELNSILSTTDNGKKVSSLLSIDKLSNGATNAARVS